MHRLCASHSSPGTITLKGVVAPLAPEIYEPVMKHLADEGIKFLDNSTYSYA